MLGYLLPLLGLYISEVLERYEFAKTKGFTMLHCATYLKRGAHVVAREMVLSLVTAALCFWS